MLVAAAPTPMPMPAHAHMHAFNQSKGHDDVVVVHGKEILPEGSRLFEIEKRESLF
jgi:hypothetical protein